LTSGSVPVTAANPTGRTAFPNNQIPSSLITPISQKLLAYYPLPNVNCALPCLNYTGEVRNTKVINTETFRIDQNFGADRVFFTDVLGDDDEPNPSLLPATGATSYKNSRLFGVEWQHSFSGTLFNEARIGYNYQFFHTGTITAFGPNLAAALGLQNTPNIPAFYDIPVVTLTDGYTSIGNGNNGYTQKDNIFQWVDDLTLIHGKHTVTAGFDIRRIYLYDTDGFTAEGQLNFTGAYTALNPANTSSANPTGGNPVADLLLGNPFSVSAPPPLGSDLYKLQGNNYNFFVEDDIRVTSRLTLNLGLRYEIPPTLHNPNNSGYAFYPANGGGLVWASQAFTQSVLSNPGVNRNRLQCCASNQLVPVDKHDFAPRFGFAWRPLKTDKFVLRGGYGIFYDTFNQFYQGSTFDDNSLYTLGPNPHYPTPTGLETTSPLALSGLFLPPVSSAGLFSGPTYTFPLTQVNWPGNHTPYNQQWSFDTQYAFNATLLLDIGYVGSHGIHEPTQWLFGVANQPPVAGDPCNFLLDASQATGSNAGCLSDPNFVPVDRRQPYPGLAPGLYANANVLSSTYNALQVQLIKRLGNGLQFHLNYTWSHSLDESSAINNAGGQNDFIMDPHNIRQDYGPAAFDQQHRFVASYSYDIPVGKGRHWSVTHLNWLIGGWTTSGIYTLASGFPFSVYSIGYFNQDQTGSAFGGRSRANVDGSPTANFQPTYLQWFNTSVFSIAPQGTYGNSGAAFCVVPTSKTWTPTFPRTSPSRNARKFKCGASSSTPAATTTALRRFQTIRWRIVLPIARPVPLEIADSDRWFRSMALARQIYLRHVSFSSV
jgi:TonB dependent receptor